MPSKITSVAKQIGAWTRYLYFMRFSILLWLFPLVLVWANSPNHARALVSGIVTPSEGPQYLCVAFFLISSSFVALTLARIVVINGQERFGDECPRLLKWFLANDNMRHEWLAPVAAQTNNIIVFWYFFSNGGSEGVAIYKIAGGLAFGVLLGFIFWYAVNALYYLTYQPAPVGAPNTARTLLFPRSWLFLSKRGASAKMGDALEQATQPLPLSRLVRFFPKQGYQWQPQGGLYEGHYFLCLASCGFFALYLVLWPLTAPVAVSPLFAWLAVLFYIAGGGVVIVNLFLAKPGSSADTRRLLTWKAGLSLAILFFTASIPWLYFNYDAERFPILALVLILVTLAAGVLGAVAFFADRFRIPVLTLMILFIVLPRLSGCYGGQEEHYLSISLRQGPAELPTPVEIVKNKLDSDSGQPVIVVTATGGGIHAAAWTAAVLGHLEDEFSKDSTLKSFHEHVVLLSTVSGGSSGLYTYLRELDPATNGGTPDWERMRHAAQCSSLEAVGWGLVYHDIPKAVVPFVPLVWSPSPGVGDLGGQALDKDRTWALRKAFARNLGDPFCQLDANSSGLIPPVEQAQEQPAHPFNEGELTLARLTAKGSAFPGFSMNTTTVEDGARFLLANYQIPRLQSNGLTPQPADSFLQIYGGEKFDGGAGGAFPDLPLATGAQLSATFPFVSSAARFPYVKGLLATHFVDGGYYDNDGTASAIEFLRQALDNLPPGYGKVKVLLIEIRNSPDPGPGVSEPEEHNADEANKRNQPWGAGGQLMAPLDAFWTAGHESVTARNRNGLDLLMGAYGSRPVNPLVLKHIVIDDRHNSVPNQCSVKNDKTDPLNWSLTPAQQCEVKQSAAQESNRQKYTDALNWFTANIEKPGSQKQK